MIHPSTGHFRRAVCYRVILAVSFAAVVAFLSGPPIGSTLEILSNPGVYIDFIALLFLIFTLWNTARIAVTDLSLKLTVNGLSLWVVGSTFDFMDEIFRQPKWMGYFCEDLFRLSGMLLTVISIYRLILRMNSLFAAAHSRSMQDELTRLPNRRHFVESLKNNSSKLLALMIIDIDFFKKINDKWGHITGDEVLSEFGKQLASLPGARLKPSRIGGEEFAVIVEGLPRAEVIACAEAIHTNARTIQMMDGEAISVSIGVGFRGYGETQQALMKKADSALYRAKEKGRNRIELAE